MGACYSKSGHDSEQTPKHKSPFHKKQHKNGVAITIEYSPVRSHDEEKLSICNPGEDDCIQREGSISGDANDNNKTLDKNLHKGDKYVNDGVATSDSGIESLSPHDAVAGDIPEKSSSQETFHDCETDRVDCDKETDQYISENNCPSGSRDAENVFHGECRMHNFPKNANRNSDFIILKPSLKKAGRRTDKNYRLSWKSTDSLDWTATLTNSMDRCRSEASEFFFSDELSIHAPLADFDSIDFLGSSGALSHRNRASKTNSIVDYNSDTFKFQFDFSGLDQNRRITNSSVPSSPLRKEGVILRQNSVNLEHVRLEFPNSKRASQEIRRFDSEASLELSSAFASLQDVKTMQIDGKDVVVIDADTYSQIMEELAMLKFRLSQLTDLIQEQELAQLETSQEKSADVYNTSKES